MDKERPIPVPQVSEEEAQIMRESHCWYFGSKAEKATKPESEPFDYDIDSHLEAAYEDLTHLPDDDYF